MGLEHFIGPAVGSANEWLGAIYNSPKNQIKRLAKAGLSKNAIFDLEGAGNASPSFFDPVNNAAQSEYLTQQSRHTGTVADIAGLDYDALSMPIKFEYVDSNGVWKSEEFSTTQYAIRTVEARYKAADADMKEIMAELNMWMDDYKGEDADAEPLLRKRAFSEFREIVDRTFVYGETAKQLERLNKIFDKIFGEEISTFEAALALGVMYGGNVAGMAKNAVGAFSGMAKFMK